MRKSGNRDEIDPEALAVRALGYLAADGDRLGRFLALTGIAPADIRAAAAQPGFLAGVLDYLLADEALLLAFGADSGIAPEAIGDARRRLAVARRDAG